MTNRIIVDTNVIAGIYDKKDVWHKQANALMVDLKKTSWDLVLLDCVVNESFSVLARRLKERKTPPFQVCKIEHPDYLFDSQGFFISPKRYRVPFFTTDKKRDSLVLKGSLQVGAR